MRWPRRAFNFVYMQKRYRRVGIVISQLNASFPYAFVSRSYCRLLLVSRLQFIVYAKTVPSCRNSYLTILSIVSRRFWEQALLKAARVLGEAVRLCVYSLQSHTTYPCPNYWVAKAEISLSKRKSIKSYLYNPIELHYLIDLVLSWKLKYSGNKYCDQRISLH